MHEILQQNREHLAQLEQMIAAGIHDQVDRLLLLCQIKQLKLDIARGEAWLISQSKVRDMTEPEGVVTRGDNAYPHVNSGHDATEQRPEDQ